MATPLQVAPIFYAQLNNDAHAQILVAGAAWVQYPLSFYYSSEISVDIAMQAIMQRILLQENATLPNHLWINLRHFINRVTKVKEAIVIQSQISSGAIHHAFWWMNDS